MCSLMLFVLCWERCALRGVGCSSRDCSWDLFESTARKQQYDDQETFTSFFSGELDFCVQAKQPHEISHNTICHPIRHHTRFHIPRY